MDQLLAFFVPVGSALAIVVSLLAWYTALTALAETKRIQKQLDAQKSASPSLVIPDEGLFYMICVAPPDNNGRRYIKSISRQGISSLNAALALLNDPSKIQFYDTSSWDREKHLAVLSYPPEVPPTFNMNVPNTHVKIVGGPALISDESIV